MEQKITLHLVADFKNILTAKGINFFKRSLWRYLAASLLFAVVTPDMFGGFKNTFLYLFFVVISIAFLAIFLSSYFMSKNNSLDADVEFSEEKIVIAHRNKDLTEERDWTWIKSLKMSDEYVVMEAKERFPMYLFFPISKLTESEIEFFKNRV